MLSSKIVQQKIVISYRGRSHSRKKFTLLTINYRRECFAPTGICGLLAEKIAVIYRLAKTSGDNTWFSLPLRYPSKSRVT